MFDLHMVGPRAFAALLRFQLASSFVTVVVVGQSFWLVRLPRRYNVYLKIVYCLRIPRTTKGVALSFGFRRLVC